METTVTATDLVTLTGTPAQVGAAYGRATGACIRRYLGDFLVNVEGEMNKVTWPTWDELKAASWVVIFTMLSLALLIFSIDVVWKAVLDTLGYLITMLAGKA